MHGVLVAADSEEEHAGPSQERHDAEEAAREVPATEESAILAEEALEEDRALNQGHPS